MTRKGNETNNGNNNANKNNTVKKLKVQKRYKMKLNVRAKRLRSWLQIFQTGQDEWSYCVLDIKLDVRLEVEVFFCWAFFLEISLWPHFFQWFVACSVGYIWYFCMCVRELQILHICWATVLKFFASVLSFAIILLIEKWPSDRMYFCMKFGTIEYSFEKVGIFKRVGINWRHILAAFFKIELPCIKGIHKRLKKWHSLSESMVDKV